jgi:hypothetical protein
MRIIDEYLLWLFGFMKEEKVYIIKLGNKRFNNKTFASYEAARKYVRKAITKRFGRYQDDITSAGFSIQAK